ncbi:signal recognition particle receptor alpha subunit, partial [Toxoplasma gondii RUB]
KGNLDVLIAACDTFRAGAVEQLRTHSRCLQVPLFERGYGKDAAAIAREALATARQEGRDVVLIDTAGRMQDNEPLMRSLAKLVAMNSPDMILFVGEALVGNDAVDQLKKFNQALVDLTALGGRPPRTVDGIILTKFDTVDDKVGAALSMVYITGQPVVFVGTGQKYPNLKKLNGSSVHKAHTVAS